MLLTGAELCGSRYCHCCFANEGGGESTLVASKLVLGTPDLLISRAAMADNCWFVGFRQLEVRLLSRTTGPRAMDGGCLRDQRSHPQGGCA